MEIKVEKINDVNILENYTTKELFDKELSFSGYLYNFENAIKKWDYWAILDKEKPIGFICGSNTSYSYSSKKDIARIMAFSILPEYKDKGIETMACNELENFYREKDCSYIYVAVNDDFFSDEVKEDDEGIIIFQNLGFKILCSTVDFDHDLENIYRRWWTIMVKTL